MGFDNGGSHAKGLARRSRERRSHSGALWRWTGERRWKRSHSPVFGIERAGVPLWESLRVPRCRCGRAGCCRSDPHGGDDRNLRSHLHPSGFRRERGIGCEYRIPGFTGSAGAASSPLRFMLTTERAFPRRAAKPSPRRHQGRSARDSGHLEPAHARLREQAAGMAPSGGGKGGTAQVLTPGCPMRRSVRWGATRHARIHLRGGGVDPVVSRETSKRIPSQKA